MTPSLISSQGNRWRVHAPRPEFTALCLSSSYGWGPARQRGPRENKAPTSEHHRQRILLVFRVIVVYKRCRLHPRYRWEPRSCSPTQQYRPVHIMTLPPLKNGCVSALRDRNTCQEDTAVEYPYPVPPRTWEESLRHGRHRDDNHKLTQ